MGGFTIVPLAQKARTKTLIADSDLNLGNYDLIATDVKGDTAEFTEFVGGVGNFSNVLGSGNLDIEGTASIKGNTQIDGNIVLEGAINNVNITDNGEITTSQGVNGADFNGASITSNTFNGATITSTKFNGATITSAGKVTASGGLVGGAVSGTTGTFSGAVTGATFNGVKISNVITVTPNTTYADSNNLLYSHSVSKPLMVLPPVRGAKYTGSIKFHNSNTKGIYYYTGLNTAQVDIPTCTAGINTITFSNIDALVLAPYFSGQSKLCGFTLS